MGREEVKDVKAAAKDMREAAKGND